MSELCHPSLTLIRVCPPYAARKVANEVENPSHGFGINLDANAVSPKRIEQMGQVIEVAGGAFVDSSIIGNPAW